MPASRRRPARGPAEDGGDRKGPGIGPETAAPGRAGRRSQCRGDRSLGRTDPQGKGPGCDHDAGGA